MKRLNRTLLVAALGVLATSAHATFFNNATGLASPEQTITFESVPLSHNQYVSTEFQSLGVTFLNAFGNPDSSDAYPNIVGNRLANFRSNEQQSGLFTIDFTSNMSAAAFAIATAPGGASTFQALLNGTVIETATRPTSTTDTTNFFGFQDIVFDQITISTVSFDKTFLLDNLQTVVSTVPEPETWALMLAGLTLLGRFIRSSRTR